MSGNIQEVAARRMCILYVCVWRTAFTTPTSPRILFRRTNRKFVFFFIRRHRLADDWLYVCGSTIETVTRLYYSFDVE